MITEDYCSQEVAELLDNKGFREYCEAIYFILKDGDYSWSKIDIPIIDCSICKPAAILCPTHQMAMKWLREIHKISIDICTVQGKRVSYMFNIWDFANIYDNKYIGGTFDLKEQLYDFNTYEEAVEAAIKYSLENLI